MENTRINLKNNTDIKKVTLAAVDELIYKYRIGTYTRCALCHTSKAVMLRNEESIIKFCGICPNIVFGLEDITPCFERKTLDLCLYSEYNNYKIRIHILFWKRAIPHLQKVAAQYFRDIEINNKMFHFLIDIDEEIYEKYCKKYNSNSWYYTCYNWVANVLWNTIRRLYWRSYYKLFGRSSKWIWELNTKEGSSSRDSRDIR